MTYCKPKKIRSITKTISQNISNLGSKGLQKPISSIEQGKSRKKDRESYKNSIKCKSRNLSRQ